MNVLILDQFSELGGAQLCLLDLIPAFCRRGWQAHVAAPGNGPLAKECRERGASFDPLAGGPYSRGRKSAGDVIRFAMNLPRLRHEIRTLIRRYDARLLYVNGPRLLPAVSAAGIPVLFHCHSLLRQRYAAWLAGRSLRSASATVVANCHFVAQPLNRWLDLSRLYVVYNGVPDSPYPHRPFVENGTWRIGVIGRISPEKGQALFLDAVRLLVKFGPPCRFVICGDALSSDRSTAAYAARVHALAAGLPVEFTGWRDDIYQVLAGLDLVVVPSLPGEATTRVILEAYAAGVPVVATASGGIPEVLADGQTGALAPRFTPYSLANRIHALMTSPLEHLRELSANARTAWRERFSLDLYQSRIAGIVEELAH
jgi:glycosyltransferase involved in cell wall biosynthesis